ncbi:hypothetical protein GCM10020218_067950 [Dactylosporangium vinaceum]
MSRIQRARPRAHNPHSTNPSTRPAANFSVDASSVIASEPLTALSTPLSVAAPQNAVRATADQHVQRGHRTVVRALAATATVAGAAIALLAVPSAASADPGAPVVLAANTLPVVIANLQTWVMGILAAVATLFLVLAGVYWATAGGDPAQVDKAKGALKNALIGYGLAVLAPILLEVVKGIVGG